ncbi:MAG: hypothetical protein K1X78_00665 [Verrucomicrobiaceae bacterium]|nr:hypothetical protein [Verrucomicrobiaceae bacterium]
MSLPPNIIAKWDAYLAEERTGVRSVALTQLESFITELLLRPVAEWHPWAIEIATEVVDNGIDLPVRMPLFRSVLFPALHTEVVAGSASAARWLAGFSQLLYHSQNCRDQLAPELQSEHGLILEAVRRDPTDSRAKHRLRAILQSRFDYSLHELPTGVLYGHNGATVEQCAEMIEELADYAKLCDDIGATETDAELIEEASFHLSAYRRYLLQRDSYANYPDYLTQHQR